MRAMSLRPDLFSFEQHKEWWARTYGNPWTRIWIVQVGTSPVGYVRYSRIVAGRPLWSGGPAASEDGPIEVSIAIDPRWRGRKIAQEALRSTADPARQALGGEKIVALILPENVASQRAFEGAGYARVGKQERLGRKLLRYELG